MEVHNLNSMRISVSILHVDRAQWKKFVDEIQIPSWVNQSLHNFEFNYYTSLDSRLWQIINKCIEWMRWKGNRYTAYGISYFLMFALRPLRNRVPRYFKVKVDDFGFNHFVVKFPELTSTMRWKRMAIIDNFLRNTDNDFLIMLTSTSILNLSKVNIVLASSLNLKENEKVGAFAGGPIGDCADGKFISGSFVVLNRDSANLVLRDLSKHPVHSMDDISLSVGLRRSGVALTELSSLNLESIDKLNLITNESFQTYLHFRPSTRDCFLYMKACSNRIIA